MEIFVTNTLSAKKEKFVPLKNNTVKMYVCGITPYDNPHLGHGRVYVTFDILYRLLKFLNYETSYCRNFTDIDDKLLNKAQSELGDKFRYEEIAKRYISSFHEDMQSLNCKAPDFEPRVTQTIPEIIEFIDGLIKAGKAYVVSGDVYYEIRSFPEYCKLSKRKLEDLKAGARVQVDESKRDPLDFALWKSEPDNTFWKSPWGWGRPGWHIECSAMAFKFLGEQIDIHGGGMDLIFPHHENELAQSEGLYNLPFVKYWMHNAFVRIDKQKMSKSEGNFFTLKEIFQKFDPMALRFYYINHNYNIPIDFSFEELEKTQKSYSRICKILSTQDSPDIKEALIKDSLIVSKMLTALCDDLNTAKVIGILFENIGELESNIKERQAVALFMKEILGLSLIPLPEKTVAITPEIQSLIDARQQARKDKNWKLSDELRDKLKELGIDVHDRALK